MRYYKIINDGYITAYGTGSGGEEISQGEYDTLCAAMADRPTPPDGYDYRLTTDLVWEQYELPDEGRSLYTEDVLQTMTNAELEQILAGFGISANMTKANMIRLILAAQGGSEEV